nr:recombination protein NinG [Gramella crocea]
MCGCYPDWLLNSENGKIKLEKATLKATKPRRDLEKAFKEKKNRDKITTLINAVKDVCHEYIRKRDEGKCCISCGTPWKSDFDAGHYYKAELFSSLKFNENNIHGQCVRCNRMLEGNVNMYEMNLPYRIGKEKFELLQQKARNDKKQVFKWDREKLRELRTYYRTKLKDLKK